MDIEMVRMKELHRSVWKDSLRDPYMYMCKITVDQNSLHIEYHIVGFLSDTVIKILLVVVAIRSNRGRVHVILSSVGDKFVHVPCSNVVEALKVFSVV